MRTQQTLRHRLATEIGQFTGLGRITILVAISLLSLAVSAMAAPNLLERLPDEDLELWAKYVEEELQE